jgi:hypothetical protein
MGTDDLWSDYYFDLNFSAGWVGKLAGKAKITEVENFGDT